MEARFSSLQNYGHSLTAGCFLIKATRPEQIADAFDLARRSGISVAVRGAGRSYNDAALNGGGIVLDLSGMNRILSWNAATGEVLVEPGVTLQQLWQRIEPDGWWPPVVSGTMFTTIGGCLGANIHGKNNFRMGPIGEHVLEFRAILPTGGQITCSPRRNADLFYAMIGGFGMLGIFTSVKLRMKRIYSGLLEVCARPVHNLHEHLADMREHAPESDYIVGWLDATAGGRGLGRGQIHSARYLHEGEDPDAPRTLELRNQVLPPRIFGVFPKSMLHIFMRPFMTDLGAAVVNTGKYLSSLPRHTFRQSHAAFHFLLDYVPNLELAYGSGGLVQYQSFLPADRAEAVWSEMLSLSLKRGLPSYLGVTKRHRPDKFLLSHALDGFSAALDFKVTSASREPLGRMLQDFDRMVVAAGGRFYFAKNSETRPATASAFLGAATIAKFRRLKRRCDPQGLLESDLYRRVFA
jgi:decaprenylphospho-beta-D-ribofuranose 2-oxidase